MLAIFMDNMLADVLVCFFVGVGVGYLITIVISAITDHLGRRRVEREWEDERWSR